MRSLAGFDPNAHGAGGPSSPLAFASGWRLRLGTGIGARAGSTEHPYTQEKGRHFLGALWVLSRAGRLLRSAKTSPAVGTARVKEQKPHAAGTALLSPASRICCSEVQVGFTAFGCSGGRRQRNPDVPKTRAVCPKWCWCSRAVSGALAVVQRYDPGLAPSPLSTALGTMECTYVHFPASLLETAGVNSVHAWPETKALKPWVRNLRHHQNLLRTPTEREGARLSV